MIRSKKVTIITTYQCDTCNALGDVVSKSRHEHPLPSKWGTRNGRWIGPGYDYETLHLCPACLAKHDAPKTLSRTESILRAENV